MNKTKFATNSKEFVNASFESEIPDENQALDFANGAEILKPEEEKIFTKQKPFVNLLKQVFLFLPGSFILYSASFVGAIILMDIFFHQRPLATLPPSAPYQIILLGIMGILGIFMVWFGFGDIKNRKHLIIPTSIIVTGTIIGVFLKATENISDLAVWLLEEIHPLIYLFPLALIIAVLAKGWADRKTEDA